MRILLLTIKEGHNSNYINKKEIPQILRSLKLEESSFMQKISMQRISMHKISMQLVPHHWKSLQRVYRVLMIVNDQYKKTLTLIPPTILRYYFTTPPPAFRPKNSVFLCNRYRWFRIWSLNLHGKALVSKILLFFPIKKAWGGCKVVPNIYKERIENVFYSDNIDRN